MEGNGRLLFPLSNSEYVIAILSCSSNCGKISLDDIGCHVVLIKCHVVSCHFMSCCPHNSLQVYSNGKGQRYKRPPRLRPLCQQYPSSALMCKVIFSRLKQAAAQQGRTSLRAQSLPVTEISTTYGKKKIMITM